MRKQENECELKTYKIFSNRDARAVKIAEDLRSELNANGFIENADFFELGIAIGGDGSFLRMVKECKFNQRIYYVGVNAGTLGFLQEIKPNKIKDFVTKLKSNNYKIEEVGIQETTVAYGNDLINKFYSLNEIVIREKELNTAFLNVKINDILLEKFVGDGLLISTSSGSTAYNLSFGGSIVYNGLHTLQITPIAPLYSKVYKSLRNSIIIPEDREIKIKCEKSKNNLLLSVDGENVAFDNVSSLTTKISNRKISCLRLSKYDYTKVINEKFL